MRGIVGLILTTEESTRRVRLDMLLERTCNYLKYIKNTTDTV